MGFFSSLLKVATSVFLPTPVAAPVAAAVPVFKPPTAPVPQPMAKRTAFGGGTTTGAGATGDFGACPTTGGLRRRTIVETFDPATGAICKSETLKGAPAVMQSDVAAANRLNRALRRLNKKQPKKLVRESAITQLKNEVVESALRKARDPCPPGTSRT